MLYNSRRWARDIGEPYDMYYWATRTMSQEKASCIRNYNADDRGGAMCQIPGPVLHILN